MGEQLQSCPFCGGEAKHEIDMPWRFVQCNQCGTTGPETYSAEESAAAWNKRYVKTCTWTENVDAEDDLYWATACGNNHWLNHSSTPEENNMKFCCYCSGELIESGEDNG